MKRNQTKTCTAPYHGQLFVIDCYASAQPFLSCRFKLLFFRCQVTYKFIFQVVSLVKKDKVQQLLLLPCNFLVTQQNPMLLLLLPRTVFEASRLCRDIHAETSNTCGEVLRISVSMPKSRLKQQTTPMRWDTLSMNVRP